jgi:hypothetical protein
MEGTPNLAARCSTVSSPHTTGSSTGTSTLRVVRCAASRTSRCARGVRYDAPMSAPAASARNATLQAIHAQVTAAQSTGLCLCTCIPYVCCAPDISDDRQIYSCKVLEPLHASACTPAAPDPPQPTQYRLLPRRPTASRSAPQQQHDARPAASQHSSPDVAGAHTIPQQHLRRLLGHDHRVRLLHVLAHNKALLAGQRRVGRRLDWPGLRQRGSWSQQHLVLQDHLWSRGAGAHLRGARSPAGGTE